ncbi:hypothetical protein [Mycolicibacterium fortuitum]|uniref:hypothetical protein n=1 Tax=Mycolicibacterium fortuitum TaxID=1766 RepID=UPI0007ECDF20|nr:hypothetical protein [Mycolicibacterium fortuitum]NOQ62526.1 hypothetical protein [Mycolicibacterium fortuitum]OBI78156.1 hypothetical protein A5664_18495 [Mycolicibacterium fortuitum]
MPKPNLKLNPFAKIDLDDDWSLVREGPVSEVRRSRTDEFRLEAFACSDDDVDVILAALKHRILAAEPDLIILEANLVSKGRVTWSELQDEDLEGE